MVRKKDAMGRLGPVEQEVCFDPPEGLELDGNKGSATVKWEKRPDGKIEITSFEGVSLGNESPDEEKSEGETSDSDSMDETKGGASSDFGMGDDQE